MPDLRVLYLGDIMGKPGRQVVAHQLPQLRQQLQADLVIAQAENASHGKSISPSHLRDMQLAGVDFFTGGNHTLERKAIQPLLSDPAEPIIAPLNQISSQPEWGSKRIATPHGDVQITSLLGATFPGGETGLHNPLHAIDQLLQTDLPAIHIVNFHGDYSSEKRIIGYYLDGRVSAVIGDHWHVPTADAMILPGGTAHITDVGMCGTLHSSLGIKKEIIIDRWLGGAANKNELSDQPPYQLNAVLITISPSTGQATSIKPINKITQGHAL